MTLKQKRFYKDWTKTNACRFWPTGAREQVDDERRRGPVAHAERGKRFIFALSNLSPLIQRGDKHFDDSSNHPKRLLAIHSFEFAGDQITRFTASQADCC
jgi:hypothetical protein